MRIWKELNPHMLSGVGKAYALSNLGPLLAGMPYPSDAGIWQKLAKAGFSWVVNLQENQPGYDPAPLALLTASKLHDLYGGRTPSNPQTELSTIRSTVEMIVAKLEHNESVVVHCAGGTGRTGTVLGATLRQLGYSAVEVLTAMERVNAVRGRAPGGWPESKWQRDVVADWVVAKSEPQNQERLLLIDLSGTLINHDTQGTIDGMPKLIAAAESAGWTIFVVSRFKAANIDTLLNRADLKTSVTAISSARSTKANEIARIMEERKPSEAVFIDDSPENLQEVTERRIDNLRVIGFLGSGKYASSIRNTCKTQHVPFAENLSDLAKALQVAW